MRAPRAYLAGFGTSGSLLAGAALIFLLASAFVGFHGWPQVGDAPSTAAVSLPALTPQGGSPASRALQTAVGAPTAGRAGAVSGGTTRVGRLAGPGGTAGPGGLSGRHSSVGSGQPGQPGGSGTGGGGSSSISSSGGGSGSQSCVASTCVSTPSNPVTRTAHNIVSTAGSALNTATKHLPGGVGNTVHNVTGTAGSTVGNVTHKLPAVVSGL